MLRTVFLLIFIHLGYKIKTPDILAISGVFLELSQKESSILFFDQVECRTFIEPLDLCIIVGMVRNDGVLTAIGMEHFNGQWFIGCELINVQEIEGIVFLDQIIITFLGKG